MPVKADPPWRLERFHAASPSKKGRSEPGNPPPPRRSRTPAKKQTCVYYDVSLWFSTSVWQAISRSGCGGFRKFCQIASSFVAQTQQLKQSELSRPHLAVCSCFHAKLSSRLQQHVEVSLLLSTATRTSGTTRHPVTSRSPEDGETIPPQPWTATEPRVCSADSVSLWRSVQNVITEPENRAREASRDRGLEGCD